MPKARITLLLALLAALVLPACGDEDGDRPSGAGAPAELSLALDFAPNPVQAPVFAAVREGLDRKAGVRLSVQPPGQGPDGVKLVSSGRVQLALLDIHDLALAREKGADVVAVGALVGRPLAAILAQPGIDRPRDLEGRTIGVSGLPSDPAFVKAVMAADGGDASKTKQVTIGFSSVQRLLTRKVDAVPAFWNAEGVALRERGRPVRAFKAEQYGAPPFPEVVIVTSRRTLGERGDDVRAAVRAIAAGTERVRADPEAAVRDVARRSETDAKLVRAQLRAVLPTYAPGAKLDRAVLERWATWAERAGIVGERPDVGEAFSFGG